MNQTYDYEVLDLGLVYYKNALKDSQSIIDAIKNIEDRFSSGEHGDSMTSVKTWTPWQYGEQTFCWQKFFPKPEDIDVNDYYYKEQVEISKRLYDALDAATAHYTEVVYPFAKANIKSREYSVHLLRYEKGGYLPAHQDHGVSSRVLSAVMYLNDDYEGGEMIFQNSGVSIKPEAGSIVFFPSNFLYIHEVAEIKSGTRYSMPHWYHNMKTPVLSTGEE
jgi:Rps23 Pro-64 3,4-dihydroxylase Tpa1-like proline 4-hydroxylase